jgi:hypothetical protein
MFISIEFTGEIIYWRGPAPFYFVSVPKHEAPNIKAIAPMITFGWGVIPADVTIGETKFYTALFPKDGTYLVPLRVDVRKAEDLQLGDMVSVRLEIHD